MTMKEPQTRIVSFESDNNEPIVRNAHTGTFWWILEVVVDFNFFITLRQVAVNRAFYTFECRIGAFNVNSTVLK